MKIGIFGGSFNPPHKMHEQIVLELLREGYLNKIILVPTGNYYKKSGLIDIDHRLAMLRIIFKDNENVIVSELSRDRKYEYTYQVLDHYKEVYEDAQIYFICGSDNLEEFKTWKKYEYIFKNYKVLIIDRNGRSREELLKTFSKYKDSIVFCDIEKNAMSSSLVRDFIKGEKSMEIERLLNKEVLKYILENKLYRGDVMKEVVEALKRKHKTISTMESCTGGGVANAITNIEGASEVIKFSAVTYANEFKIKMGVEADVIDTYSVYSIETAREMAKNISKFANSNYGIGITGKLKRVDKDNLTGADDAVFVSIYDANSDTYFDHEMTVDKETRNENKELIISSIVKWILEIL